MNYGSVITGIGLELKSVAAEPAAPAINILRTYSKTRAGRALVKTKITGGLDSFLQTSFAENNITLWSTTNAATGTWMGTVGAGAGAFTGALPTNTNLYTVLKRSRYANVVTTVNQVVGQRNTEAMFFLGNIADQGGFFFISRFGFDTWTNGSRFFAGLHSATTVVSADPSTLNNTVGFCIDAADNGAISFLTRGTIATKAVTGFTAVSNKGYEIYIYALPNSTTIGWTIVDLTTLTENSGTATTNQPAVNTMLTAGILGSNGALATANAINLGINKIYIETQY